MAMFTAENVGEALHDAVGDFTEDDEIYNAVNTVADAEDFMAKLAEVMNARFG